MTGVPAEDGIYDGISETTYHADRESLSSSGARKLLPPSTPEIFHDAIRNPRYSDAFDVGHAAHAQVLGVGGEIVVVDAPDWRTKAAREQRDQAHAEGKTPLLEATAMEVMAMAAAVRMHPLASAVLAAGMPELSGYWHDQTTGARLRYRPDWLTTHQGRVLCVDYKTSTTADPTTFARKAADYGYHQQAAWYLDGLAANGIADDAEFWFIAQSKARPYPVTVLRYDAEAIAAGRTVNRQAIDLYARCRETGQWPGYPEHVHTIALPPWHNHHHAEENNA